MATRHGSATVTLPSDTDILITRSFEAPRNLVWRTLTEPKHILNWWGPLWCPIISCEIDLRVGGGFRYVCRMEDGTELGWHGTYRAIEIGSTITATEVFEGFPEAESVNTMTLTELDGVTTLQTLVRHATKAFRDGHIDSGMEPGMQATFDRLDDLLGTSVDSTAAQFRRVAGTFSDVIARVSAGAWSNPAPCEGWVAQDVVRHLVEWVPGVIGRSGLAFAPGPDVNVDPAGAWAALAATLQDALDDPAVAAKTFDAGPPGQMSLEQAIGMLVTGDVLIHTWDLSTAAGFDVELDPALVSTMYEGMQPIDEILRSSGHYGPRIQVADDSDLQTKLIAFTGRKPFPTS
jgi:uncharacterized protein (TIGR03086 family)